MVSSGTEATMSALRLARGFTGRSKILKLDGCYHGHADGLLVAAGSGVATLGIPGSPGVPAGTVADTLVVPYNDLGALEAVFATHGPALAAVIVEPVAGNMGCVAPRPGYLEALRQVTRRHGTLLIFDEVMTGFRLALGGAQALFGVTPDLTCLGKIIGGGLPVGAYGGRAEIMEQVAPNGPIYQAGTLSGNPLAMAAGCAALDALAQPGVYDRLETLSRRLEAGILRRRGSDGRTDQPESRRLDVHRLLLPRPGHGLRHGENLRYRALRGLLPWHAEPRRGAAAGPVRGRVHLTGPWTRRDRRHAGSGGRVLPGDRCELAKHHFPPQGPEVGVAG